MRHDRFAATACSALLALAATQAGAEPVYGLTLTRDLGFPALVSFDSAAPDTMSIVAPIQNIVAGQTLRAIDFRPSNGLLYALSSNANAAQLYTVDLTTGALTAVGSGFAFGFGNADDVSIDFNPVNDRLRIVTTDGANLRVDPNTGSLAATDTAISDGPSIAGIAYSNDVAGATSTTLYGYDYLTDQVDTIGSVDGSPIGPNSGQTFVVGDSGLFSFATDIDLDISSTGLGYSSVYDGDLGNYGFYRFDLATGAHALVGAEAFALVDFAVRTAAVTTGGTVPEPDSLALLGLGAAGLVALQRRPSRPAR